MVLIINAMVGLVLWISGGIRGDHLNSYGQLAAADVNPTDSPFLLADNGASETVGASQSLSEDENKEAVEKLALALLQQYSYRDLRGVDWDKRIAEFTPKLEASKTRDAFVKETVELLSAAKDIHIWLKVDNKTIGTHTSGAPINFNPRLLPKILKPIQQHGTTVLTGIAANKIHYVAIGTWDHREPKSMQAAYDAVRRAAVEKAPLIIDVRPNSGGDESQAQQVAGYFVKKPTPYSAHRSWSEGKAGALNQRVLKPTDEKIVHPGPCIVLMGPQNMSSCESFLRMMKSAGAKLIGQKSYGASGNPMPHDLGNGVTVFLPSWQDCDLDGNIVEGKGVDPDVVIETSPDTFKNSDPVLAKAIELLK